MKEIIPEIKFEIFHPINLNEIFIVPEDRSPWKDEPRYLRNKNGHNPNRDNCFSFSQLLSPKNELIKAFFKHDSSSNYGIYILIFKDFKKFYVGVAARYSSLSKGGVLKEKTHPEGFLKRLRKHRAKCTGTFAQGVNHTNKTPYGWRDFALEREKFYTEKKQINTMRDCLLSLIVFNSHEDYKYDDKGILERLESYISKNGISKYFGEEFNDYESFAHTNSQDLDFMPVFKYRDFKETFMNEYPNWDSDKTPNTHKKAKVSKTRNVSDVYAIEVTGGKYRSATLDGVFELVNPPTAKLPGRVLVRCSWFGVTPPTTYPQLNISSAKVIQRPNYTGKVADDISL